MKTQPRQGRVGARRRLFRVLLAGLLGCTSSAGCTTLGLVTPTAPPPPADSLVLRGEGFVAEKPPEKDSAEARLAGAHELFRRGDYEKACDLFHSIRDKKHGTQSVNDEATFYEAECLRMQARYPKAADTYAALLKESPNTQYKEQAAAHIFEIANYWLEDTRRKMREAEKKKGWSFEQNFFHIDKTKPFADEEGRAIEKLELVHYVDINGSMGLGDRALFYAGAIKFYNEDYKEAEHFLSQVHENHPNSPLAPQAIELAIIAKTMAPGGPDYDGRKVAEARALVDTALRNYPALAEHKEEFLSSKLLGITIAQSEKDLRTGDFYRRTGHEGSAWFYYRLVERRYPNTPAAVKATKHLSELEAKLRKEGKPLPNETQDPTPTPPKKLDETTPPPRRVQQDIGPPPGPLPPQFEPGKPLPR